mmetsp:Transcript_51181/g.101845  ORF Transcript_51181/g.101845 Transcript_51181/m.101845 type:complete len:321 (-) Transcript_51181:1897-2859(-)
MPPAVYPPLLPSASEPWLRAIAFTSARSLSASQPTAKLALAFSHAIVRWCSSSSQWACHPQAHLSMHTCTFIVWRSPPHHHRAHVHAHGHQAHAKRYHLNMAMEHRYSSRHSLALLRLGLPRVGSGARVMKVDVDNLTMEDVAVSAADDLGRLLALLHVHAQRIGALAVVGRRGEEREVGGHLILGWLRSEQENRDLILAHHLARPRRVHPTLAQRRHGGRLINLLRLRILFCIGVQLVALSHQASQRPGLRHLSVLGERHEAHLGAPPQLELSGVDGARAAIEDTHLERLVGRGRLVGRPSRLVSELMIVLLLGLACFL